MNEDSFEMLSLENIFKVRIMLKISNSALVKNYCMWRYDIYMAVTRDESTNRKTFWIPALSTFFPALEIRKQYLLGKILWFSHSFENTVNSFDVSLDITVMINILQEIIKDLQQKMLKATNLYWLHKNPPEK